VINGIDYFSGNNECVINTEAIRNNGMLNGMLNSLLARVAPDLLQKPVHMARNSGCSFRASDCGAFNFDLRLFYHSTVHAMTPPGFIDAGTLHLTAVA
jgi:hypothetical protein